jgi:hypothetical protein
MVARGNQPWQSGASYAQAAHVSRQQEPQRYSRRTDHQLQHLEPDDLVNEGRTAATGKQQQAEDEIDGAPTVSAAGALYFTRQNVNRATIWPLRG